MALVEARKSSFRAERRPWMLKDYLRDDISSCSSNGFRSFPRRQCCVAVINAVKHSNKAAPKKLPRNKSISSALQRASVAVINAVKLIPFKSRPVTNVSGDNGKWLLTRSLSKKLFKRSFWLKSKTGGEKTKEVMIIKKVKGEECEDDEIERWISSGVVGVDKYQPLDLSNDTTVTTTSNNSTNNSSDGDGKSDDSWSDITFSSDYLTSCSENDVVERREKLPEKEKDVMMISERVGVTAGDDDSVNQPAVTKSSWCNEKAEKEQSSPVSTLDFPENDEGSSSPFTLRVTRLKGTTERLMEKLGRFESLAGLGLEPLNLESIISSTERDDSSPKFSIQSCSTPTYIISSEDEEEENDDCGDHVDEEDDEEESRLSEVEKKAANLLNMVMVNFATKTTYKFEPDNLLLDFFRENVMEKDENTLLKAAESWLNGHYDRLILGWEVKDKRQAYIRDMEEGGRWPRDTKSEKEEVAAELGAEVMSHLIDEMLFECCSS